MNKIVEMLFGSHLYGTNTETSDTDIKGVFMPAMRDLLLQNVPKTVTENTKTDSSVRNTAADTDKEFYSLHYFLKLAVAGETVALDMLHAPLSACRVVTPVWADLVGFRRQFYTKNLKALVGYARKQAAKYGVKGSRLSDTRRVLEFFSQQGIGWKVQDVWENLPTGEYIRKLGDISTGTALYEVCGKKMVQGGRCSYYVPMLEAFVKNYGHRANLAEANQGIDWKAVSHAFRAAYQVRGILRDGEFSYPLPDTDFIKLVKGGTLDFLTQVAPSLDILMDEVEQLSEASTLPERVDQEWVDAWLYDTLIMNSRGTKDMVMRATKAGLWGLIVTEETQ